MECPIKNIAQFMGLGFQIKFKIFKVVDIHINISMFTGGLRQWSLFHLIAIGTTKLE